jgi:hypothetical protein
VNGIVNSIDCVAPVMMEELEKRSAEDCSMFVFYIVAHIFNVRYIRALNLNRWGFAGPHVRPTIRVVFICKKMENSDYSLLEYGAV